MSERKGYDPTVAKVGKMLYDKRISLGPNYRNREDFIEHRSQELFGDKQWISPRYLASLELGKNLPSIEKLILLANALEEDPVELFRSIVEILLKR